MNTTLKPGTQLAERYRIVQKIGQGDFGIVYLAHDLQGDETDRQVAIKQMPMQMIVDCERQADIRENLVHRNIPRISDYFSFEDHSFLVGDFILGSNLETILKNQWSFLPSIKVILWAIQLCEVLDYLHTHPLHPVIFRDMKPSNVMLDPMDKVVLADFGLARAYPPGFFETDLPEYKHLQKGLAIGTAGYSPPEQYEGHVNPLSDIYALGASLHHLLTLRDPRLAKPFTFQDFPVRSLNSGVSQELDDVVMQATQNDPYNRFESAAEMLSALERLV